LKAAIVAYSLSGNTAACAFALAKTMDAGVFLLEEVKPRYGKKVFFFGGFQASFGLGSKLKSLPNLTEADVVLLGMPVWAGTIPPAVNTLLKHCSLRGKTVYAFVTQLSSGVPSKLEKSLKETISRGGGNFKCLFVQQAPSVGKISVESILSTAQEWAKRILAEA
jgi:flavodoxin